MVLSALIVDICGLMILIGLCIHGIGGSAEVTSCGLSSSYEVLSRIYILLGSGFILLGGFLFILSTAMFIGESFIDER